MKKFDTVVIGFGKAGKTLAVKLSKQGEKVALIEKDSSMYGGTCINVGCIPSKKLVEDSSKTPKANFEEKKEYYKNSIKSKVDFISKLNKANYDMLINAGVEVIDGIGSFIDKNTLQVEFINGSKEKIKADKIIINTGAKPFIPEIEGIKDNSNIYISEAIMNLEKLPKRLTIIGAGYIGLEFAFIFSNFGSEVTVLQDQDIFLSREDRDVADEILKIMENKGIKLIKNAKTEKFEKGNTHYKVNEEKFVLEADAVLLATGRRPNIDSLNIQNAGVEVTDRNAIKTDKHMRTNIENIWAAGDVRGDLQFTYISLDDSRIILSDIKGDKSKTSEDRGAFAYSSFIEPALSRVGLTEEQAIKEGYDITVKKIATMSIPKAKILNQTEGFLKAVIDNKTNQILGAALICPESYEIINIIKLAMDQNLDYKVLGDFIYTHPTMAEALNNLFE